MMFNIQKVYLDLYATYKSIFTTAYGKEMTSLALTFVSLNDEDFEIGLLALNEYLKEFLQLQSMQKKIQLNKVIKD